VLIPSLSILGPDLMAQEAILASWVDKSIGVFCRDEPDLGADDPERRRVRSVLGEIEAPAQRFAGGRALGDGNEIEDGQRNQVRMALEYSHGPVLTLS